jgi:hypothetical protein
VGHFSSALFETFVEKFGEVEKCFASDRASININFHNIVLSSANIESMSVLCMKQISPDQSETIVYLAKSSGQSLLDCLSLIKHSLNYVTKQWNNVQKLRDAFYSSAYKEIMSNCLACRGVSSIHYCKDYELVRAQLREIADKMDLTQIHVNGTGVSDFDHVKCFLELKFKNLNSIARDITRAELN